jgi:hypothetical protein
MIKFLPRIILFFLVGLNMLNQVRGANWYSRSGQTIPTTLTNWTANPNGTGASPSNFTTATDTFFIQATHNYTQTAAWVLGADVHLQILGTLNFANSNFTVGGTTTIRSGGIITDNNNAGTNTFTGLLTIQTGGSLNTANTSPFVFSGGISNSGTLNKSGTGAVTFNATQTFSLNAAVTSFSGDITVTSGTLTINGNNPLTIPGSLTSNAGSSILISNTGSFTVSGTTTISGGLTDNNNAAVTTFTGLLTLTSGTLDLSALSTANCIMNGGITYTAGTFNVPNVTIGPSGSAARTITATSAINWLAQNIVFSGTGAVTFTGNGGTTIGGSANINIPAALNISGPLLISTSGAFNVAGATVISGVGNLTDNNNAASSTFTGSVTLTAGTLDLSALNTANCVMNGGITYTAGTFNVPNVTIGTAGNITLNATSAINWLAQNIAFTGAGTVTFTGSGGTTLGGTGNISIPQNLIVSGSLLISTAGSFSVAGATTVNGTGSLTENNNATVSTFTGLVTLTAGTLDLSALSTVNCVMNGGITYTAGTFNVPNVTIGTAGNRTVTATSAINWLAQNIAFTGAGTITFTGAGGTTLGGTGNINVPQNLSVFNGPLLISTSGAFNVTGTTSISGTGSLTDNNNGAASTFTGLVTLTAGTMDLSALNSANCIFNGGITYTAGTFNVPSATIATATTVTATSAINWMSDNLAFTGSGLLTISGAGGVVISGTAALNIPGALTVNASSSLRLDLSGITTISGATTFNGLFDLNGKTARLLSASTIGASGRLNIGPNGVLRVASGVNIACSGVFRVVGSSGSPATITNDGSGTYTMSFGAATSVFHANNGIIEYTGGAGITITNGSIDATNNLSNTTFRNGSGTAYMTITTPVNLASTVVGAVFESGPTFNISRTSGTGAITFTNAGGALASGTAGEGNDNDNGNPGTLLIWSTSGSTFYSQGNANFSSLTNWNSLPAGGGTNPTNNKLTDGSSIFIVQDFDAVIIDQDISLKALSLLNGATLTFGNNATGRTVVLDSTLNISSGAIVNIGASNASHVLTIRGNLINNGQANFAPTSSRVINVNLDGASGTISGTTSPIFNNITFNSPTVPFSSVVYTTTLPLDINGTVTLNANAVFNDGGLNHTIGGNWYQRSTTALVSTGTLTFDGNTVQSIGSSAPYNFGITFNNLTLSNALSVVFNTACTVNGAFLITSNTAVSTGASNQTFNGNFSVAGGSSYSSSATTIFNGTSAQSIDFSNCFFSAITFSNSGIKNTLGIVTNAISGLTTISAGTTVDGPLIFLTNSRLLVNGTCNWSGTLTFSGTAPGNPSIYTTSATNTMSLGTADVIIDGQHWAGFAAPATANNIIMGGNLTIKQSSASSYLVITNNTTITGAASKTFTIDPATTGVNVILYCRGVDNFPTGFGTVQIGPTSHVIYDATFSQTVRGNLSYGNLRGATSGTKTADGPLDINGSLQLYNGITFDLNGFDHTLEGNIDDSGTPTVINTNNTGTFTMDAPDANQIFAVNSTGTYTFNNFIITQTLPTATRTKTFRRPFNITGNFSMSNPAGDAVILLSVDLIQNDINAIGSSNTFTLGSNVWLNIQHPDFGASTMPTFEGAKSMDPASVFNYNGSNQTIANGFTYGSIFISGSLNKTATASLDINGYINGNSGVFVDGGFPHTVAGNWLLNSTIYANPTSLITLDGVNQGVLTGGNVCTFANLTSSGSGTKTMNGSTITILNNFNINNGSTFDANTRSIVIRGDWIQQPTGIFSQLVGALVLFNGTTANQNITSNDLSAFGGIRVNKPTANRLVKLNSTINIDGFLDVYGPNDPPALPTPTSLDGAFDFSNQNIYVGDNFFFRTGSGLISNGSTLYLDGSNSQDIIMNCTGCSLNNLELSNAGAKTLNRAIGNLVDVNGYVNINGATFNGSSNGIDLTVAGDWTNSGVFQHNGRTVTFDGANQLIGQSTFGNVVLSGTGTKTLGGSISLSNSLTIGTNITFDVTTANYGISVGGDWNNFAPGSVFMARNGVVTFNGTGNQLLLTGSTVASAPGFTPIAIAGKSFYDVVVNKSSGWLTLGNATNFGDLDILDDLTISSGTGGFSTGGFDIVVRGNYTCSSTFQMSNFNSVLVLTASSGSKTFTSGASASNVYRDIYVNAPGVTYTLQDNITITNNGAAASTTGLILNGGTVDLNGKTLVFNTTSNSNVLTLNAGTTFIVGSGGNVLLSNANDVLNNGGTLIIVGNTTLPATFSRASTATTGYTIVQTSGTLHAKYYKFEFLNNATTENGLQILGGTIDAVNNLSEGTFTNGLTNSQQYLDLTGFTQTWTAENAVFNAGPLRNVKFTSGSGQVTFSNASGTLAGAQFENDDASASSGRIRWNVRGFCWDGGAGDGLWNSPNNWVTNTVPTANDTVILDHSVVTGAYTVNLNSGANAVVARLIIDKGISANAITLSLGGTNTLTVRDNFNILSGCTLVSTSASNNILVAGNFTNAGTYIPNSSTLTLNPTSGSKTLTLGTSSLNNLVINGSSGTIITLASAITLNGNLTVNSGELDVTSGNFGITLLGNWLVNTTGLFTPRSGTVTFNQSGATAQTINGGSFFNLTTSSTAAPGTKQLLSNLTITNNLLIGANTTFDAGSNNLYVGGNFTNNSGSSGYIQSGTGTIYFNGVGNQAIENGTSTSTFNNVVVTSTAGPTKTWGRSSVINGNFEFNSGGTLDLQTNLLTGPGSTNSFTISSNGWLRLTGSNNFPSGFETISLSNLSTVDYFADLNQTVFSVPSPGYGSLFLRRASAGNWVKTAAGELIIQGNLTINDLFTTLDCNTNSANITLTGNLGIANGYVNTASAPINWGTGTTKLTHIGTGWDIDADIVRFNNLVINTNGNVRMRSNLTITGDVFVNSGTTLTMDTLTMTGLPTKTFTLNNAANINCAIPFNIGPAFPINFGTYILNPNSFVFLNSPTGVNQTCKTTGVTYGNLQFNNVTKNVTLENAPLVVAGYFYQTTNWVGNIPNPYATLIDNGQNITVAGDVLFGSYVPSSPTLTQTFNGGGPQTIRDHYNNALILSNVVFSGAGLKTFGDGTPDIITINGNLTINPGAQVITSRTITFNGNTWSNIGGSWTHNANTVTFNNTGAVSINVGATNSFFGVNFTGNGVFTFNTNNADINSDFTITAGTVNTGALTHSIAGNVNVGSNTFNTSTTNFNFDGGNQSINTSVFTARDIVCTGTGTKTMASAWNINNLTINTGVTLNTVAASSFPINLTGNWLNSGAFSSNSGTVTFNGNTSPITVNNNNSSFNVVNFNPTSAVTYNITAPATVVRVSSIISSNASVLLNSNALTIGSNTASPKFLNVDGLLEVNANSVLRFDNRNGSSGFDPVTMTVSTSGTFKLLGTPSNIATLTYLAGAPARQIININGNFHARYYLIEFVSDNGINISSTATLDPVNNLSDGTWSNISNAGGTPKRYLVLNCPDPGTPISNVTFNFSGSPTIGVHYNVQRSSSAVGDITFVDALGGNLGDFSFEDDAATAPATSATTGKLRWPGVTLVTWTGAINSDWHNPGNWSPNQVPTSTISANIPLVTNNPNISNANASCKNLTISNGQLTISSGFDLNTFGNVTIGTGSGAGVISVNNSASFINCAGNWTRGTNGVFVHGNGTVVFTGSTGASTITPLTSSFFNVELNNAQSVFYLVGSAVNFAGSINITAGQLYPNTANYSYNVGGNLICNGTNGVFSTVNPGTVTFNGAAQSIVDASLFNVVISGTGIKQTTGDINIVGTTVINSNLTAAPSASNIDFNGNVTVNSSGTFNDGGNAHTFSGVTWTGTGAYSGAGTVTFDRSNSAQTVAGGKFNNLILNTTNGSVTFTSNVSFTGDLYVSSIINSLIINSGVTVINTTGTGTCTLEANELMYCRGVNSFPASFASYDIQANSNVIYDGSVNQNVYNTDYGNLTFGNANTKTLLGDVYIKNTLLFGPSTLDVTTSNFMITLQGNWNNNANGTFIPRNGEVVFSRNNLDQNIYIGTSATNPFYDLKVDKTSFALILNSNTTIRNNLNVISGIYNTNTYITYVGNNLEATGGTFSTSGTFFLNNSVSGTPNILTNGSSLNNLTINASGATYNCQDNLTLVGDFNLMAGTFNGNGKLVRLGDNTDGVSIAGTYKVGAGGIMAIGNNVTTTVTSTGILEVVGSSTSTATVTRNTLAGAGSRYSTLQVNSGGQIAARYYLFEFMSSGGILLNSGSIINATNNFSDGTFNNGVSGGVFLQVENNQRFTTANGNPIRNVAFPTNPGGVSNNVRKLSVSSDTLEFYNATGVFAGELFDGDNNNFINWTGPVTLTWDGSSSTDWYSASNWTPSAGPEIVPTGAENVIIATAANQPIINVAGALTKNLTINSGANLSITTTTAALNDLSINGDIIVNGILTMSSANDGLVITGNWTRGVSGSLAMANGTVNFNGPTSRSINNGSAQFGNVIFTNTGAYSLGSAFNVSRDLTISSGSLDVSAGSFTISVGGNFTNNASINPRAGKIVFNATTGTRNINPGTTNYFDLEFNGGGSAVYLLTGNNLSITRNCNIITGTFNLNGLTFNMGDNSGGDFLSISGTLIVPASSFLRMGQTSSLTVNTAGTLSLVGSSASNVATLTRNSGSTGNYSVSISSGGTIAARYYLFEFLGTAGLQINNGAFINSINNLSDGTFSSGASGGRYLNVACDLAGGAGITMDSVIFNAGPSFNCVRTTGNGNLTFLDPSGSLGTFNYEQDELAISATQGRIRWSYSSQTTTWTGNVSTQWNNPLNWDIGIVPNSNMNAIIPDVTLASNNFPLINSVSDSGTALNLNIYVGASITFNNNKGIDVYGNLSNAGTINVTAGSTSLINVSGNWSSSGTFTPGASTVNFRATTGSRTISSSATSSFFNVSINSTVTYTLASILDVNGNLVISAGTLDVSTTNFNITLAGNLTITGNFIPRSGTLTLDGTSGTQTLNTGTAAGRSLFNLNKISTSTSNITLASDIDVNNNFTVSRGNLGGAAFTIFVAGNFTVNNTSSTFTNVSVVFDGNAAKTFTYTNTSTVFFNNVTINKTGAGSDLTLAHSMGITGTLNLLGGDIILGSRSIILGNTANIVGGSASSYIQADNTGFFRKNYSAVGGASFNIPIGDIDDYSPLTFKLNSGTLTAGAFAQFRCIDGNHPNFSSITPAPANYISRWWDFNVSGITSINYDVTMNYTDADIFGTEAALMPGRYSGTWRFGFDLGNWSVTTATNVINWSAITSVGSLTGVNSYNVTIASGNYSDPTRWSFGTVPSSTDMAIISSGTNISLTNPTTTVGGLYVGNGATLGLNGNNLNSGSLNINSGGNVNLTSGSTLTLTGSLSNNGNFNASPGSTVVYAATIGNQCIAGLTNNVTYANLTASGTGIRELCDSVRINGNLTVGSTTVQFRTNGNQVYISGNISNAIGTFTTTGSRFTFEGNTTVSNACTFTNVTIKPASALTLSNGSTTITSSFINNGTFNHGGGTVIFNNPIAIIGTTPNITFNNLTTTSGCTTLTAPTGGITLMGNWLHDGGFNANNSTTTFAGNTNITHSTTTNSNPTPAGVIAFRNVTITGALTLGSHNISLTGDWTSANGTFNSGIRTVTYTGTAATQTISTPVYPSGLSYYRMVINKTAGELRMFAANNRLAVTNALTMQGGNFNQNGGNFYAGDTLVPSGCNLSRTSGIFYNGYFWRYLPTGSIASSGATNFGLFPIGDTLNNVPQYRPFAVDGSITTSGGLIFAKHTNVRSASDNLFIDSVGIGWVYQTLNQFTEVGYPKYPTSLQLSKLSNGNSNGVMAVNLTGRATFSDVPVLPSSSLSQMRAVINDTCLGNFIAATGTVSNPTVGRSALNRNNLIGIWKLGTISRGATPLPVELLTFSAEKSTNAVKLKWTTLTEVNNDYFDVLRSSDGIKFESIGRVKGAGNAKSSSKYSLLDPNPLKGENFYQLKQVDFDSKSQLSQIIKVSFETNTVPQIRLYPNPVSGVNFKLDLNSFEEDVTVIMRDVSGKEIFVKRLTAQSDKLISGNELNTQLPPGVYLISVNTDSLFLSEKLIIK